MKRFGFEFEGKAYHLRKLDQETKEEILDFMTAARMSQLDRLARKGYRTPVEVEADRQSAYIKWGSKGFLNDLHDEENAKKFLRALLVEEIDDATLFRMVEAQKNEDAELMGALRRMAEDADPKAMPRPPSGSTPTAGAGSS